MHTMILKGKCDLASVSHEKKVEMRYKKERVVVCDWFLRGKGLRIIYDEIIITENNVNDNNDVIPETINSQP